MDIVSLYLYAEQEVEEVLNLRIERQCLKKPIISAWSSA